MAHKPTTTNDGLIYSIRDAVNRMERILAQHEVDEWAPGPNETLADLDEQAWDAHDVFVDLIGEEE